MIFIGLLVLIIILYFTLNKTSLKKYNKNNILFCIIIFIIFTLIQGLRGLNIGTDTNKYAIIYDRIKEASWISVILKRDINVEIGFGLLMKIVSIFSISFRFFLILVALIINGGLAYFIYKNSKNPLLSIIIFMGIEFFNLSFTALRQMIAVIIILNTYTFINKNKTKTAFALIILASMFHTTALVFLPVLLYKRFNLNRKTFIILFSILILIQLIGMPLLDLLIGNTYYGQYLHSGVQGEGITQLIVISIYTVLGIVLCYKNKKEKEYDILILIMITAVFIQSLTWKIQLIGRLMWYFYIFNIIYLPNIISDINNIKTRNSLNIIVGGLNIAQFLLFSIHMYNVEPYILLK